MRLSVNLSALHDAAKIMGAKLVDFTLAPAELDPIDIGLTTTGIEVSIDDIEKNNGLLSYKGRHILLYIKDHGFSIDKALMNGADGRRYHVADCKTLQSMRERGRYARYHAITNLTGEFPIFGTDAENQQEKTGSAQLKVCMNCLKQLNYRGYDSTAKNPKNTIWKKFDIGEFFTRYSSLFEYLPSAKDSDDVGYTHDWNDISKQTRKDNAYCCEQCRVDLHSLPNLLHVHHINGVKNDNSASNLKVLCIDCHRKQTNHQHMFLKRANMQAISRLRREQSLHNTQSWQGITKLADTAFNGLLPAIKEAGVPLPQVGYPLRDAHGKTIAQLDLAWPESHVCIPLADKDKQMAEENGWQVRELMSVIENAHAFKNCLQ